MKDLDANLIIANAPDPVFVSDLQGKILLANEAVSELLGLRKDEVLEQSLSRFVSRDEARELMGALHEVVERGVTRNVRLNPRSASGEVIATSLNASALREPSGEVIGVIGILRDMRALDKAHARTPKASSRTRPIRSSSPISTARSFRPTTRSIRCWASGPPRSSSSRCHASSASMKRGSSWPRSVRSWPVA